MREPMELLFGVVGGLGPYIDVLCGVHVPQEGGFGGCLPHWPNGSKGLFLKRNVFDACVKS